MPKVKPPLFPPGPLPASIVGNHPDPIRKERPVVSTGPQDHLIDSSLTSMAGSALYSFSFISLNASSTHG